MNTLKEGLSHTSRISIDSSLTAKAIGSGDLDVFASPAMIALMENAAMLAVRDHIDPEYTTVGGHIDVSHLHPTAKGREVEATAVLTKIEGKKLTFSVEAHEGNTLIGRGTHLRFIVHRSRFLSSLS